jgi:hypothetical protein
VRRRCRAWALIGLDAKVGLCDEISAWDRVEIAISMGELGQGRNAKAEHRLGSGLLR